MKTWRITVKRDFTCRRPAGIRAYLTVGNYELSELTDISYGMSDGKGQLATLLVSQILVNLANGSIAIDGPWP